MHRNHSFGGILLIGLILLAGTVAVVTALDRFQREVRALRCEVAELRAGGIAPAVAAPAEAAKNAASGPGCPNARFFAAEAESGGRLIRAIGSDVASFNPITENEAQAQNILGCCTAPLAVRDFAEPERFVPMLAESWKVQPDRKTIVVHLRKGVRWQDYRDPETGEMVTGKFVTAADFAFYVAVVRNEQVNGAALRVYYQDLEELRVLDDHTFEVRWKNEYFRMLELTLGMIPLPRHFYCNADGSFDPAKFNDDHRRNRMIVGCGPYQLAGWVRDQQIVLKRFPGYFGRELGIMPPLETLTFEIVKTPHTRLQMLKAGQLDAATLTPEQWSKQTQGREFAPAILHMGDRAEPLPADSPARLRKAVVPGSSYFYIGYNLRNPLFQDRQVRQALTMLVNRERIVRDVLYGLARVISGPFFYDSPNYDRSIAPWPFDPARAQKQLAAAGWRDADGDGILEKDGRKFVFTAIQVANNPTQEKILTIVKEDFAKAGIDMKIAVYEWPVYLNKIEARSFEMCSLGWSMPYESDPYQVWFSTQADVPSGSNHVGFKNAEADRLMIAIRAEFDPEKRAALCREFHRLLHEEQPYTFLMAPEGLEAFSARYRNVRVFPLGLNPECWWVPKSAQLAAPAY